MEVFEIHITGDESIHEAGKSFGYKTIAVDLLKPDGSFHRTEHMTSVILKSPNYVQCLLEVRKMMNYLFNSGVKIERIKVESPYYDHYVGISRYMESHFESKDMLLPTSKNQRKSTLLATDRTYNIDEYPAFREKYRNAEVELCLSDSNVGQDADWFLLYKERSNACISG